MRYKAGSGCQSLCVAIFYSSLLPFRETLGPVEFSLDVSCFCRNISIVLVLLFFLFEAIKLPVACHSPDIIVPDQLPFLCREGSKPGGRPYLVPLRQEPH